ncbi:MAG: peroxidase-related enzyme, partial [Anaerolineales bacterium]
MKNKRAWINIVAEEEADGELKALYQQEFDSEKQGTDNILAVHSLNPPTLRAHADLYHTVMHAKSP